MEKAAHRLVANGQFPILQIECFGAQRSPHCPQQETRQQNAKRNQQDNLFGFHQ